MRIRDTYLPILAAIAASPAAAQDVRPQMVAPELRLTPIRAFGDATPLVQLLMGGLLLAAVAAVVVWAMQARATQPRTAYLQGLAAAGPVLGLLGAVYGIMNSFLGISNVRPAPSLTIVAPGVVEALLCFGIGLLAAAVALICRWQLEGRVGRARTA